MIRRLGQRRAEVPAALAGDPVGRERFFTELRITRQVSRPNVWRVNDIAELDEPASKQPRYFVTMGLSRSTHQVTTSSPSILGKLRSSRVATR